LTTIADVWLEVESDRILEVAKKMAEFDNVSYVACGIGESDVSIQIVAKDTTEIYQFITEVVRKTPEADTAARPYDRTAAAACWRVLVQIKRVLDQFRGRFLGKTSPIHFWWGSFDLAHTRFSGRRAPVHPGGVPNLSDAVTREAYSHECISIGWWPGGGNVPVMEPAFYAYAYPEPPGCPDAPVSPSAAGYDGRYHMWLLPYEAVRRAPDPDGALLAFAESTYAAAARLSGWARGELER
jgi:hypothetical protein